MKSGSFRLMLITFIIFFIPMSLTSCRTESSPLKVNTSWSGRFDGSENTFEKAVEKVKPSVVGVLSESDLPTSPWGAFREDFFDRFFKGSPFEDLFQQLIPPETKQPGKKITQGSGIILNKDGHILTNNHLIADAQNIVVKLHNKSEYIGKIVGQDPNFDLAVIKISGKNLEPPVMGNSDDLRVGQWVIAVGSSPEMGQTATIGIVSAKGKSEVETGTYRDFIQTDASIYPGNTGGPLIDLEGKIIGVSALIIQPGQGIGFVVPINIAKKIANRLITRGGTDQLIAH